MPSSGPGGHLHVTDREERAPIPYNRCPKTERKVTELRKKNTNNYNSRTLVFELKRGEIFKEPCPQENRLSSEVYLNKITVV